MEKVQATSLEHKGFWARLRSAGTVVVEVVTTSQLADHGDHFVNNHAKEAVHARQLSPAHLHEPKPVWDRLCDVGQAVVEAVTIGQLADHGDHFVEHHSVEAALAHAQHANRHDEALQNVQLAARA